MLRAGTAITDISPEKGVRLEGFPHCDRKNKGVHDPLYASCLYLESGRTKTAIITMDLLYIGKSQTAIIRSRFKDTHIMLSASHTHSGPRVAGSYGDSSAVDAGYVSTLIDRLTQLIERAKADTFDAEIGFNTGRCGARQGIGGNRRKNGGICDDSVNMIAVRDKSGVIRACLLNYALHPTYLHAENELVTADYPGYIRRFFKFARPDALFMFAQGAAGDQSSRYHRVGQDFDEAARVGTTLAAEGNRLIEGMEFTDEPDITVKSEEIELPLKEFSSEQQAEIDVQRAKAALESVKGSDYIAVRNAELELFGRENLLKFARLKKQGFTSGELPCEIQVITFSGAAIVGIQGELFVEYGLRIKQASPYRNTFVFSLTNGFLPGYVYTREALQEGGYEVGSSMLAEDAGEKIVNKVKEML